MRQAAEAGGRVEASNDPLVNAAEHRLPERHQR
jgi:hypothetical protein